VNITPSPRAFASCPRCGVTVPDKTEIDDEYEFCYKCDLELSELAGGWASWNRNSPQSPLILPLSPRAPTPRGRFTIANP